MANVNERIGNYVVISELNSGAFGSIYKGRHLIFSDDPIVAIKVLHARLGAQEQQLFIQEVRLLKKLHHPHILPIIEADTYYNKAFAFEGLGRTKEAQQAREKARQLGYNG